MQLGLREYEAILRVLLSLAAGGILGYERSSKGIDAGFRTHILVCMSSCVIMLANLHIFAQFHVGDPTRMPAQVISGVGFLGAGCILVTRENRIKGVTTAAGVWSAACLGLCIGAGDYIVAGCVLIFAFLALTVFRIVDVKLHQKTKYLRFYAEFRSVPDLTGFLRELQKLKVKINEVDSMDAKAGGNVGVVISIHLKEAVSPDSFVEEMYGKEGIVFLSLL